jgi:hypothetical protein
MTPVTSGRTIQDARRYSALVQLLAIERRAGIILEHVGTPATGVRQRSGTSALAET